MACFCSEKRVLLHSTVGGERGRGGWKLTTCSGCTPAASAFSCWKETYNWSRRIVSTTRVMALVSLTASANWSASPSHCHLRFSSGVSAATGTPTYIHPSWGSFVSCLPAATAEKPHHPLFFSLGAFMPNTPWNSSRRRSSPPRPNHVPLLPARVSRLVLYCRRVKSCSAPLKGWSRPGRGGGAAVRATYPQNFYRLWRTACLGTWVADKVWFCPVHVAEVGRRCFASAMSTSHGDYLRIRGCKPQDI